MLPEYQEYHDQLLTAIGSQGVSDGLEMGRIEACFKISLECWGKVRKLAQEQGFKSAGEEIHFFRNIKPLFTSFIEYFTYCYHALLFMPAHDTLELKRFWKWELSKIDRFRESNRDFCQYIQQGLTDRDEEYFLRSSHTMAVRARLPLGLLQDPDAGMVTSHDQLVTLIGSYDLYEKHIAKEMEKLGEVIVL
jgi:hypothetical protein